MLESNDNKLITPFFILGNPRSGTSLFRLMLNSHPNLIVPPESGFLQWWFEKYRDWKEEDSLNNDRIKSYINDILSSKKIIDWGLDSEIIFENILKNKPKNYSELSTQIYLSYKSNYKSNVLQIGDKNNYYIYHLTTINSIYPNAKYIHLIRDGRDVACSYKKIKSLKTNSTYRPNLVSDIIDIAKEWNKNINNIDNYLNNKKCLKVKYEDLLIDTERTLFIVCEFLGISYHSQMLDYYKPEFNDEPLSTRDWKMKTLEPIDKNNSKKYKHILTKEEIQMFNNLAGNVLRKNLYEL